ncbi:MAG: hypothetical protein EXS00_04645 [Phycisphaerales bacterium]|nr:hypothetical protein [Phycisphaerales bacterium]
MERSVADSVIWSVLLVIPLLAAGSAGQRGQDLKASWWDRTAESGKSGFPVSSGFTIRSDAPSEVVAIIGSQLARATVMRGAMPAGVVVRSSGIKSLHIFGSQADYLETLRTRFGAAGRSAPVVLIRSSLGDTIAVCTEGISDLELSRRLAGELMHNSIIIHFGTDLPPWVETGLCLHAEGGGGFGASERALVTSAALGALRPTGEGAPGIALSSLVHCDRKRWSAGVGMRGSVSAIAAWSLVEFLMFADGGRYRALFDRFLLEVSRGVAGSVAWSESFGDDEQSISDMEVAWKKWLSGLTPDPQSVTLDRMEFLARGIDDLLRRGVQPTSFDGLWQRLVDDDTFCVVECYGAKRPVRVSDGENHAPLGESEPARGQRGTGPKFEFLAGRDSPGRILTSGCSPELQLLWRKGAEPGTWAWRIERRD